MTRTSQFRPVESDVAECVVGLDLQPVENAIRDVPDFPVAGVVFKDIAPVLSDPILFKMVVDHFAHVHRKSEIRKIAGIEARGFMFGAALAYEMEIGFVPIRKKGKLPGKTAAASYDLEYGRATIEIHEDAVFLGEPVLLIDDLLATGGTAAAAAGLLELLGAEVVEINFLIELAFLNGRKKLNGHKIHAPIVY